MAVECFGTEDGDFKGSKRGMNKNVSACRTDVLSTMSYEKEDVAFFRRLEVEDQNSKASSFQFPERRWPNGDSEALPAKRDVTFTYSFLYIHGILTYPTCRALFMSPSNSASFYSQ